MFISLIIIVICINSKSNLLVSSKDHSLSCPITVNSTIALILARGGSKGIPKKNLVKLDDKSLLGRTLNTIKSSKLFQQIWVSTDCPKIEAEALNYGASVHIRPSHIAADRTTSMESVQEFLSKHSNVQSLALIQCTSVFLREKYLQEAWQIFNGADCVFSVQRLFKLRWKENKNGTISATNFDPKNRPRRQDWNGELYETGMFYFARRSLLDQGIFQNNRCRAVEVDPADAIEIDTPTDLKLAETLIQIQKLNKI